MSIRSPAIGLYPWTGLGTKYVGELGYYLRRR